MPKASGGLKSKPHYAGRRYRECVRVSRAAMRALARESLAKGFFWPAIKQMAEHIQKLVATFTTDGRRASNQDVVERVLIMALEGQLAPCTSPGGTAAFRHASRICACCKAGGNSHASHSVFCDNRKMKSSIAAHNAAEKLARDAVLKLQRDAPSWRGNDAELSLRFDDEQRTATAAAAALAATAAAAAAATAAAAAAAAAVAAAAVNERAAAADALAAATQQTALSEPVVHTVPDCSVPSMSADSISMLARAAPSPLSAADLAAARGDGAAAGAAAGAARHEPIAPLTGGCSTSDFAAWASACAEPPRAAPPAQPPGADRLVESAPGLRGLVAGMAAGAMQLLSTLSPTRHTARAAAAAATASPLLLCAEPNGVLEGVRVRSGRLSGADGDGGRGGANGDGGRGGGYAGGELGGGSGVGGLVRIEMSTLVRSESATRAEQAMRAEPSTHAVLPALPTTGDGRASLLSQLSAPPVLMAQAALSPLRTEQDATDLLAQRSFTFGLVPLFGVHRLPRPDPNKSRIAKRQPLWLDGLAQRSLKACNAPAARPCAFKQLPEHFGSSMSSRLLHNRLAPPFVKGSGDDEIRPAMPSLLDAAAAAVELTVVNFHFSPWNEQIQARVPGRCLPCPECAGLPWDGGGYEHRTVPLASTTTYKAVIHLNGQLAYLKQGRSKCNLCDATFGHAERATLAALKSYGLEHLTADVPFTQAAANGDLFLSRQAEQDLVSGVARGTTPGSFASRLSEIQAKRADCGYATYLAQGRVWYDWLELHVGDEAWAALSLEKRLSDFWIDARVEYQRYRDEPNKVEALNETELYSQRAFCIYPVSATAATEQYLESFQEIYPHVRDSLSNVGSRGQGLFAIDDNKSIATALGGKW